MNNLTMNEVHERRKFMDDLLLADESQEIIEQYIDEGEMFEITYKGQTAGVCLFTFPENATVEIKNIGLRESMRGSGIGSRVIDLAAEFYKQKNYRRMIVGTANSSIENIAFYQKSGFRFNEIKRDFFLEYPQPIYENGIRALDMLMFEKVLIM